MALRARKLARHLLLFTLLLAPLCALADARFDLVGPKIDVRVTRTANGVDSTLPIAAVPNLQPGDKLWLHPDLPPTQSVHYLLICVFLRGTTNPPPDDWFIRIQTWDKKVREEGVFVTVPQEAEQAVLLLAPETGGDFSTLRSAVKGKPGIFVRASQDLSEAGFEQARIEKYLASIRRVPPSDPKSLQEHSDLLARTLALKPNPDCFKQSPDTQFTCLTQTGTQTLLDDGHGQSIAAALSNGPSSDFINQASYTRLGGAGEYSAYVGAIVDLVRLTSSIHTAQYQYIPAIAFPQDDSMNLRLNTPPSFHNPKSVLVIGLPAVQKSTPPPLRPADATHVACLLEPTVTLPIEGAPLVFSTNFAQNLTLHLNTPPGAPSEPDIPLVPDAYLGGLVLQTSAQHHTPLHEPVPLHPNEANPFAHPDLATESPNPARSESTPKPGCPGYGSSDPSLQAACAAPKPAEKPIQLTGTIKGNWGFDPFTGPTVQLQQLPGAGWHIVAPDAQPAANLIAGHSTTLLIASTGSACVHTIAAHPTGSSSDLALTFKPTPKPDMPNLLTLTLPLEHTLTPGDLHLAIQQFGQPKADTLSARTFSEPSKITSVELHAGDKSMLLTGIRLAEIQKLTLGDLVFTPQAIDPDLSATTLRLALPPDAPHPPTHADDHLTAAITLHDGRSLTVPVTVSAPRPAITLLSKSINNAPNPIISLPDSDDLPLTDTLTFTLKTPTAFPRNGQLEIETLDGTLRTVLTLAPSGGLLLQDPHTIVATLDPLRSFGPSAFGALHMRTVYPLPPTATVRPQTTVAPPVQPQQTPTTDITAANTTTTVTTVTTQPAVDPIPQPEPPSSDWLPLATLVRLPTLTLLTCPTDEAQPCALTGSNLFLIEALSTDPQFSTPTPVPDGFTGTSLTVPHPATNTLFLRLRDDPAPVDAAMIPTPAPPTPPPAPAQAHHHTSHPVIPATPAASTTTPVASTQTPTATSPTATPTAQTLPTSAAATPTPPAVPQNR
jgi:hypothetical protein